MKKLNGFLVYGTIILLILVSYGGYHFYGPATDPELVIPDTDSKNTGMSVLSASERPGEETTMGERNEAQRAEHIKEVMRRSTIIKDPTPIVGAAMGNNRSKVARAAIENAGGLGEIIKEGDTVFIKVNAVYFAKVGDGVLTDYRVVEEIANIAKENGAARIIVADGGSVGDTIHYGPAKFIDIPGIEVLNLNGFSEEACYYLKPGGSLTGAEIPIPSIYMDADVVISAAKLKTHRMAGATLSLKNAFGVPPLDLVNNGPAGQPMKAQLHAWGIEQSIVDINMIRRPDFVVIDGIIGMEGNSPDLGTPIDSGIIFAGSDPVAVDTVGVRFMGIEVSEVPHIGLAAEKNLGVSDLSNITVVGVDLDAVKMEFKRPDSGPSAGLAN